MNPKAWSKRDEASLLRRLRNELASYTPGDGVSGADALMSALLVDARRAKSHVPMARLLTLTGDEILALSKGLTEALDQAGCEFALPHGTVARSWANGAVSIGGEVLVRHAGSPGLHPFLASDGGASGPNLELLRAEIADNVRGTSLEGVGLPSARYVADDDGGHLLQFRPFAPAGGVVLQRRAEDVDAILLCSASPSQIQRLAHSIRADMRKLVRHGREIGGHAVAIRAAADEAAREMPGVVVAKISVDLPGRTYGGPSDLTVEYEAIDDAMRPGPFLQAVKFTAPEIEPGALTLPRRLISRVHERNYLQAIGADGRIDDLAAAIAVAAPQGLHAVLARLRVGYETYVSLPTAGGDLLHAVLYWRDGTIHSSFNASGVLDGGSDTVDLPGTVLPETLATALLGKPLSAIAEVPFACDRTIISAENHRGLSRLVLDSRDLLVNLSTGRIWEEAAWTSLLKAESAY